MALTCRPTGDKRPRLTPKARGCDASSVVEAQAGHAVGVGGGEAAEEFGHAGEVAGAAQDEHGEAVDDLTAWASEKGKRR